MARTTARSRAAPEINTAQGDAELPPGFDPHHQSGTRVAEAILRAQAEVIDLDLSPECRAVVAVLTGHLRAGRKPEELAAQILVALADVPGPVEQQVRADIAALGVLDGARGTYARVAYRLARALDAEGETTGLAGAAREMRAALAAVWSGVKRERPGDRAAANLGQPV